LYLMHSTEWIPLMPDDIAGVSPPSKEQISEWKRGSLREMERIGGDEFAQRLKVPAEAVRRFLEGNDPDPRLARALSVYDFDPYSDLKQLMLAYFYESYDYVSGSLENWQAAVDEFIEGEGQGTVAGAASDIRKLVADVREDEAIRLELENLGCRFAFRAVPLTPREWIEAVHDRLIAALGR
jgi:hypothetical protein